MRNKRLLHTALIVIAGVLAVTGVVDDVSHDYAEDALKRALATFAISRALNGVISVAQGTELALEPGGVGVVMTPGQILDPVNDLVERFSGVMLVAASSLGLQVVLLEITSWIVITALLLIALAVWLAAIWSDRLRNSVYVGWTLRVAVVLAFVRFAVPVVIMATNFLFATFLADRHDLAAGELQLSATEIEERMSEYEESVIPADQPEQAADETEDATDRSLWESMQSAYDNLPDLSDIGAQIRESTRSWYDGVASWFSRINYAATVEELQQSAAEATRHIINLIVVFVLQTIILPLGFLWLFLEIIKGIAARSLTLLSGPKTDSLR